MKKILITSVLMLALGACSGDKHKGQRQKPGEQRVVKVMSSSAYKQEIFFSGVIKPLSLTSVSTPFDSVIVEKKVSFGQTVKKGDLLFVIESSELEKEYDQVLAGYLKAKDDLSTGVSKFSGTDDLWKLGLISKNEYVLQKSNLSNLKISMVQKERELDEMFRKIGRSELVNVKKLQISDTKEVTKALETRLGNINIYANTHGVLLEPPKTGSELTDKNIEIGTEVKQGSPIALIGNMEGVSVNIKVSEIDLQKIVPGVKAVITGVAFPGQQLEGVVTEINSQASSSGGAVGGLPTFSGSVSVKSLTDDQKKMIKVGMSAKVSLLFPEEKAVRIPIDAVYEDNGKLLVQKKVNGKFVPTPVVTGTLSPDAVSVEEGVMPDDEILVPGKPVNESH